MMRGRGRAARAHGVLALAVSTTLVAGCGDGRGDPPPRPAAGPAVKTCVTSSGGLVADLNGDGSPDRVSPPSLTGTDLVLTFGAEDGRETEVAPRQLVGDRGEDTDIVVAVVADFDQDGWVDLYISATRDSIGDDPELPSVSELRLGPFSPRGQGQGDQHVDLYEPHAAAVADYDHDRYPDLAAYVYEGDGVYSTVARLGGAKGLDRSAQEENQRYAKLTERGSVPDGPAVTDWTTFHPTCDGDDAPA
ncbi:FG-GAP repeat domain-containing protein [Streptomyces abyssomicinicus]|uniref:FG-GAP repeat domain-containing protein n=1 Tax=Streptomyces abyssomicinicus TaxID=574929 RepID=UPI001250A483|nr:VCBS repeat-containing protein [Streptomyces abyssomicinicus]